MSMNCPGPTFLFLLLSPGPERYKEIKRIPGLKSKSKGNVKGQSLSNHFLNVPPIISSYIIII